MYVFQDTFRVFSKDDEGCIPADEMKFVLKHLPGKVGLNWNISFMPIFERGLVDWLVYTVQQKIR